MDEVVPRIIAVHLLPIEIRVTRIVLRREEVERLPGEVAVADVVDADK